MDKEIDRYIDRSIDKDRWRDGQMHRWIDRSTTLMPFYTYAIGCSSPQAEGLGFEAGCGLKAQGSSLKRLKA